MLSAPSWRKLEERLQQVSRLCLKCVYAEARIELVMQETTVHLQRGVTINKSRGYIMINLIQVAKER